MAAEEIEDDAKPPKKKAAKAKPEGSPKKPALPKKEAAPKAAAGEVKPRKDLGPKPPPPSPWEGTFFWGSGKVHKNPNSNSWRAFVDKRDKKDRKVKIGDNETASFHRALEIIEEGMVERGL